MFLLIILFFILDENKIIFSYVDYHNCSNVNNIETCTHNYIYMHTYRHTYAYIYIHVHLCECLF